MKNIIKPDSHLSSKTRCYNGVFESLYHVTLFSIKRGPMGNPVCHPITGYVGLTRTSDNAEEMS